jgi:hypothetical protein
MTIYRPTHTKLDHYRDYIKLILRYISQAYHWFPDQEQKRMSYTSPNLLS